MTFASPLRAGAFSGSLTANGLSTANGALAVTGVVTGAVTTSAGEVVPVTQTVTTTVRSVTTDESSDVLNVVLGPVHLDAVGTVMPSPILLQPLTPLHFLGTVREN